MSCVETSHILSLGGRVTGEFNVTLEENTGKYSCSLGVGGYSKYNTK